MFDEQCEESALARAARAVGPMRVARAQQSPWDTTPSRDSCGTAQWIGGVLGPLGFSGSLAKGEKGPVLADRALVVQMCSEPT